MRTLIGLAMISGTVLLVTLAGAQPPRRPEGGRRDGNPAIDASAYITRMMTFDANQDGKLSKDEVTDARLLPLFDRADANTDGVVTKEELTADFNKEFAALEASGPGGPSGGGPGRRGPGRPGGPGMGGPPPLGQVLPPHIQDMLKLSNAQTKKLDALQKHVDNKLAEILTDDQKQQLEGMRNRGPGGPDGDRGGFDPPPGGPGGPGGNRGRDGGPPGERGRPKRPTNDDSKPNE